MEKQSLDSQFSNLISVMFHQISVTWHHIRRSPYQAAAAVMIMTLTVLMGLSFFLLSVGSQRLLEYLERKPQIIVFFDDTITSESQVEDLIEQLKGTGKISTIKFISKEQALEVYKKSVNNEPILTELVTSNILPSDLEFSAKNVADIPALYELVKKAPNIEEIRYQKDVINNLINVFDKIRKFGVGLVSFLILTSLLVILTIIGMKISLRREEIDVERLVGASKWYIRWPFLLEGLFYGVAAALISWTTLMILIWISTPYLLPYLSGLSLLPLPLIPTLGILGGTILAGALVGIIGSFLAVWRYLKN